jgi:hypothetical protein
MPLGFLKTSLPEACAANKNMCSGGSVNADLKMQEKAG